MAQPSTPVSTANLPAVGLCAVTLPADGPSIHILPMPDNGHLVAYDKHTWTRDQIDGWVRLYVGGDYQLIEPAKGGE